MKTDLVAIVAACQVQIEDLTEVLGRRRVVLSRLEVENLREVFQDVRFSKINLSFGEWLSGGGVGRELVQLLPGVQLLLLLSALEDSEALHGSIVVVAELVLEKSQVFLLTQFLLQS